MQNIPLWLSFTLSLLLTIFYPALLSIPPLIFFAPFFVLLIYRKPLYPSLLWAMGVGLLLDLLSGGARFGMHALTYFATLLLIYDLRKQFFADSYSTLPLMTYFFAAVSSALQLLFYALSKKGGATTLVWLVFEVVVMPLWDALYAFVLYSIPQLLFGARIKRGKEYFMQSQDRL